MVTESGPATHKDANDVANLPDNPRLAGEIANIEHLAPEILRNIFNRCGDSTWRMIVCDELPYCDNFYDKPYGNTSTSALNYLYTKTECEVEDLYDVSSKWHAIATDLWDTPHNPTAIAVQQTEDVYSPRELIPRIPDIIDFQTRLHFTSLAMDIDSTSFPRHLKDVFPNVTRVDVHESRSLRLSWRNESICSGFRQLLAKKETIPLLNGDFDAELCTAAWLPSYFTVTDPDDDEERKPVSFIFTYVLTTDVAKLQDAHLYAFPHSKLAFKFEVTLREEASSAIVIEKPTALTAKFFIPAGLHPSFNRSSNQPREADELWAASHREDVAFEDEIERRRGPKVDRSVEFFEAFSSTLTHDKPDLPKIESITYD